MRRKALTVRGVTVSDSFSVREEGAKNLPSFKMERDKAESWQQELGRVYFQVQLLLSQGRRTQDWPYPMLTRFTLRTSSTGCPNITSQWPRKHSR